MSVIVEVCSLGLPETCGPVIYFGSSTQAKGHVQSCLGERLRVATTHPSRCTPRRYRALPVVEGLNGWFCTSGSELRYIVLYCVDSCDSNYHSSAYAPCSNNQILSRSSDGNCSRLCAKMKRLWASAVLTVAGARRCSLRTLQCSPQSYRFPHRTLEGTPVQRMQPEPGCERFAFQGKNRLGRRTVCQSTRHSPPQANVRLLVHSENPASLEESFARRWLRSCLGGKHAGQNAGLRDIARPHFGPFASTCARPFLAPRF